MPSDTLVQVVVALSIALLIKNVLQYFTWRARIDAVGGPEATILGGTAKASGNVATPGSRLKGIRDAVSKYPRAYRVWQGPAVPLVYLCHPDTVKPILSAKSSDKSHLMNKLFSPHLGQSIFTTNGDNWKRARKLFTPAFHFKVLDDYLSESVDITNEFVDELLARSPEKVKEPIDVQEDLEVLTLKILLQSVFSTKTKDKGKWGHAFCEATKRCEDWVAQRIDKPLHLVMPNFAYFRTQNGKTFKKDASEMHALCRQMIRERMDANAVEGEDYLQNKVDSGERLDFLDICLSHTDADGNPISEDEILAQTVTFVAAGFGTTTSAVAFVLHLLAKNKDAQQRCHEEAVELLSDGQVDLNLLSKLKYINMCFKEGTRIFPPVGGIVRDLPEAKEINGVMVEAGTTVIVSIYGIHHNPEVWPEPEKFDPERFDPDGPKRDPFSWIIFSAGARNCIGQKYADMQSKMIMAKLLRAFEFDVVGDKSEVQPVPSVILKSANGVWLRATPRDVA